MATGLRVNATKLRFLKLVQEVYGEDRDTITRPEIIELVTKHGSPDPAWLWQNPEFRSGRGVYKIPAQLLEMARTAALPPDDADDPDEFDTETVVTPDNSKVTVMPSAPVTPKSIQLKTAYGVASTLEDTVCRVPDVDPLYVPFGNYFDIEQLILHPHIWNPFLVTGETGNGKTLGIEQACARNNKILVPVSINAASDEDSLIGGLRLVNGTNVPYIGPVPVAMLMGAHLMLDEVDTASKNIMCLQSVLRKKPIYISRLGIWVHPAPGFSISGTANTKGQGSEDGRYVYTNTQNGAFMDRFITTFEQDYPDADTETKILSKVMESYGLQDDNFVSRLIDWATQVRQTFKEGGIGEQVSTPRLIGVCSNFAIFGDRLKAVKLCTNRFDEATKVSLVQFYTAIDEKATQLEADAERNRAARALRKEKRF